MCNSILDQGNHESRNKLPPMFSAEQWSSCELMKARIALSGSPWVRKLLTRPSKLSRKKASKMHSCCFWNSTVMPQQITHSGLQRGQNNYTWCSTYMSEEPNMTRSVWACQTRKSVFLSLDTKTEWSCIQVNGYKLQIDLQITCRTLEMEFALSNESLENGEAKKRKIAQEEPSDDPKLKVDFYKFTNHKRMFRHGSNHCRLMPGCPQTGLVQIAEGPSQKIIKNIHMSRNHFSSQLPIKAYKHYFTDYDDNLQSHWLIPMFFLQNGLFIHEKAAFIHLQQQTNNIELKVNPEQQQVTNFSLKNSFKAYSKENLNKTCKQVLMLTISNEVINMWDKSMEWFL